MWKEAEVLPTLQGSCFLLRVSLVLNFLKVSEVILLVESLHYVLNDIELIMLGWLKDTHN